MAIGPPGVFRYRAALTRTQLGGWVGSASPSDPARHPGLAGDRPEIEISAGILTLRGTEAKRVPEAVTRELPRGRRFTAFLRGLGQNVHRRPAPPLSHYDRWGPPASMVTIQVGDLIGAVAQDADVLTVFRAGTGDLGISLRRHDALVLGIGAVDVADLMSSACIDLDPRVQDQPWYGAQSILAREGTGFLWLNADFDNPHSARRAVETLPAANLVIAIAGKNREARRRLNQAVSEESRALARSSCWYFDIDDRFTTREQWLEYVRALPTSPPPDLWIRISVDGTACTLRAGEYLRKSPWHLFVHRIYRWGIPGQLSQLAIVREHADVTEREVVASTERIASARITIVR